MLEMRAPLLLGRSPAIETVRKEIATAARTDAKVLILGETGVGKDEVARLIHHHSERKTRPFVPVNCSGIPDTLLESELFGHAKGSFTGAFRDAPGLVHLAHRGTLFLDELGEMSPRMQATLLRFAETGEVHRLGGGSSIGTSRDAVKLISDVRLITATNRDLRAQIAAKQFREDLYYRLNVIQIDVPPLRDRGSDIMLLIEHFLEDAARKNQLPLPTLDADAAQILIAYQWPGNVRELRNVTERLVLGASSGTITPHQLPSEVHRWCGITREGATLQKRAAGSVNLDTSPALPPSATPSERVDEIWTRLMAGEDFWTIVRPAVRARDVTRHDLLAIVDRGLRATGGNYRKMLHLFHLESSDYKRFHSFLYQYGCTLPVQRYRQRRLMSDAAPTD